MKTGLQAAMACLTLALAEPPVQANDLELWNMYLVTGPIKGRLLTWTEAQPRFLLQENGRIGQLLLRQALGIRVDDRFDIFVGYQWQSNTTRRDAVVHENRIYQQLSGPLFTTPDGIMLQAQTRLEQRMFVGEPTTIWRATGQLRLHVPLHGPGSFGPIIANELFYNLNSSGERRRSGFEQQRTSVGLFIPLGNGFNLEPSYMYRRLSRDGPDRVIHVANIRFIYRLGRSRKAEAGQPMPEPTEHAPLALAGPGA